MKDGEQVIELLSKQPATAKFISTKLARRFVSDNPPPALVDRMSKTFLKSDGDIREVMRTMIYSPEFWSREAYRAKVKTPFELVVTSARALGTDVDTPMPLVQWVGRIGEPLYQCQPPTGYSDKAETWVNAGALLNRLNFSLALAGNKVRGSRSDVVAFLGSDPSGNAKAALDRAVQLLLRWGNRARQPSKLCRSNSKILRSFKPSSMTQSNKSISESCHRIGSRRARISEKVKSIMTDHCCEGITAR